MQYLLPFDQIHKFGHLLDITEPLLKKKKKIKLATHFFFKCTSSVRTKAFDLKDTDRVGKLENIERRTNALLVLEISWDLLTIR